MKKQDRICTFRLLFHFISPVSLLRVLKKCKEDVKQWQNIKLYSTVTH